MRFLYFDVDTLRADHLGCYGYPRPTSPNIDDIAARGVRFEHMYASDTPCLPSRTALMSGRFGIHSGVINHGGKAADPFAEGGRRGLRSASASTSWPQMLRDAGLRTATISTFGERHSAYHWYAGFNEVYNLGRRGRETADEVGRVAIDWLDRHGAEDDWFLHVHFWDPHTPYRTPEGFGEPFADSEALEWIDESVRMMHWLRPGPHSAQEVTGFDAGPVDWPYERQPRQIDSLESVRRMADGYDTGIRYADAQIGAVLRHLEQIGVGDDTAILVSSDHGENLGELGIYGDHQTADFATAHIPFVLLWPGLAAGTVDSGLLYQIDGAATILQLLDSPVPAEWDGRGFASRLLDTDLLPSGEPGLTDRPYLVLSQAAWSVQRSVRFEEWLCIYTYDDAFHGFDEVMLFDLEADPHEQSNLASSRPDVVGRASLLLHEWHREAMRSSATGVDPLWTVLAEGGGWYVRGQLQRYVDRLRSTGREGWADRFEARPLPGGDSDAACGR